MTVLLAAVLGLTPLLIVPGLLFYFDVTPKIAVLLVGAAAALPWLFTGMGNSGRSLRRLGWLLGAQALSLTVSTLVSTRPELSVYGTSWRRFGLITQLAILILTAALAVHLSGRQERMRGMLRAIVVCGIPIAIYGALQYSGWDPWLPAERYHVGEGIWRIVRPPATLGHASYAATYLLSVALAGACLWRLENAGVWRWLGGVAVVVAVTGVVLSGTRAAVLGLVLAMVFLAVWFRPRWRPRAIVPAAASVALLALFYISPAGQALRGRVRWSSEDFRGGARLWLWRDSLRMSAHRLAAGWGPETFSGAFPKFQSLELSRAFPEFYHESAHNLLLDSLTAQGLPGLVVMAGLTIFGFAAARKARQKQPVLAGLLGAGLVAIVVSQQFSVFSAPTALYYYATLAMLAAAAEEAPQNARRWPRPWMAVALPISVVLILVAARAVIADRHLYLAQRELAAQRPGGASRQYAEARRLGLSADLWYSRSMAVAALQAPALSARLLAWQQALESGVRATRTAEDPYNAYLHLATLYARQNDLKATEQNLRSAAAASPNWFKPHWLLAQVLAASGRREEARAEAGLAVGLNGGKNIEVSRTWEQLR